MAEQAELKTIVKSSSVAAPMGSQAEADEQRMAWGQQWATGTQVPQPQWPEVAARSIPDLTVNMFRDACRSFPSGTGLGWDNLHPRALIRVSHRLLLQLVLCMLEAERTGQWPDLVGWVIVVLLPKPDGGRRPIGLLPLLARIWYRTRRSLAAAWEAANARDYLYGGVGKGAEIAAWKQAVRAELAARSCLHYGQGLLDLVKAYERIPYWILLREARRQGYPLWLIRLSVATYKLLRVIRVDDAMSTVIQAIQGIVAGSDSATTEMRLPMTDVIDSALKVFPTVTTTVFVDDVAAETDDADKEVVVSNLVVFL